MPNHYIEPNLMSNHYIDAREACIRCICRCDMRTIVQRPKYEKKIAFAFFRSFGEQSQKKYVGIFFVRGVRTIVRYPKLDCMYMCVCGDDAIATRKNVYRRILKCREKKWFFSAEKTRWAQNHFFAPFGFFCYIPTCMCMSANNSKTHTCWLNVLKGTEEGKKKIIFDEFIDFFYSAISAPLRILRFLSVNSTFLTVRVHANSLFSHLQ